MKEGWAIRVRSFLLACLMAAAALAARRAYASIRPAWERDLPEELLRTLESAGEEAEFVLRGQDGFVAVCPAGRRAKPERITDIELSTLRSADRALLERGIPVSDRRALLELLEDLGS
ncbi:MAG: hypothetical protein K6G17_01130 [Oscillospiraceae bacterium]|nr:hypothetical protein [Oscillospiraceae bacterium]